MRILVNVSHVAAVLTNVLVAMALVTRIWIYLDIGVNWNANIGALFFLKMPFYLVVMTIAAIAGAVLVRRFRFSAISEMICVWSGLFVVSYLLALAELWKVRFRFCGNSDCQIAEFVNRLYSVILELAGRLWS